QPRCLRGGPSPGMEASDGPAVGDSRTCVRTVRGTGARARPRSCALRARHAGCNRATHPGGAAPMSTLTRSRPVLAAISIVALLLAVPRPARASNLHEHIYGITSYDDFAGAYESLFGHRVAQRK